MRYQTFIVKTSYAFPLDMLRYDSCFPATSQDAVVIENLIVEHTLENRAVKLGRYVANKNIFPSIERWNSFQCRVSNVETR